MPLPLPPSAATAAPSPSEQDLCVGTLQYTPRSLRQLFGWLLAGDVLFVLINQIEPRVLPVLLKAHGANDREISIIVSMIPALMNLLVNPFVSYASDRTRSRWGRRIPYLVLTTPFVALFLALTPFAPELAQHFGAPGSSVSRVAHWVGTSPVILIFGLLVFTYQLFQSVIASVFFYLLRDVVPMRRLGRFMSLFRIFGALSTFILTYWLLSIIDTHAHEVFISVAVLALGGLLVMCWRVKEGDYPPVTNKVHAAQGTSPFLNGIRNYVSECFSSPVYWWMYGARALIYAAMPVMGFLIFFPQLELGMGLEKAAQYTAWPSLVWVALAYPVGVLIDRWGIFKVLSLCLWGNVVAYVASFCFVQGPLTFLVSAIVTGVLYWAVMLAQLVYLQALVHPQRVGQLSSANAIVQSLLVAVLVGPFVGWFLDTLKTLPLSWSLPWLGHIEVGPYRCVNLILAALFLGAQLCVMRSKAHWRRLGGPAVYNPPL